MSEPHLLTERDGHVLTITFHRPEARNAWSLELMARMADAWRELEDDPELRVAILTGNGKAFSAGADLKLMHGDQSDNPWHKRFRDDPELQWKAMLRSWRPTKPIIAAVKGICFTLGIELMLACDIVVAEEGTRFSQLEVKRGIMALGGATR